MIKKLMAKAIAPKAEPTIEDLEREVLATDSPDQLYGLEMAIRRFMNNRHDELNRMRSGEGERFNHTEGPEVREGKVKGMLNIAEGLLGICLRRQDSVLKENHIFNRRFREAASKRLSAALYNELCNDASGKL